MFPNVEELGRGDLGQVQVRRLLCFVGHDASFERMLLAGSENRKRFPTANFSVSLVQTHPLTVAPARRPPLFNPGGAAAVAPLRRRGRACTEQSVI